MDSDGSMSSGASSEAVCSFSERMWRTSSTGLSSTCAMSSAQQSPPLFDSRLRIVRSTWFSSFTTCTGSRIVRDWFMMARSMFWRIHQVA